MPILICIERIAAADDGNNMLDFKSLFCRFKAYARMYAVTVNDVILKKLYEENK